MAIAINPKEKKLLGKNIKLNKDKNTHVNK